MLLLVFLPPFENEDLVLRVDDYESEYFFALSFLLGFEAKGGDPSY